MSGLISAHRLREIIGEGHPDHAMAFADLFAVGCLLHAQGQRRAGLKLIEQVRHAVTAQVNQGYLADLLRNLSGNELRFAHEIHAHLEINELIDEERYRSGASDRSLHRSG